MASPAALPPLKPVLDGAARGAEQALLFRGKKKFLCPVAPRDDAALRDDEVHRHVVGGGGKRRLGDLALVGQPHAGGGQILQEAVVVAAAETEPGAAGVECNAGCQDQFERFRRDGAALAGRFDAERAALHGVVRGREPAREQTMGRGIYRRHGHALAPREGVAQNRARFDLLGHGKVEVQTRGALNQGKALDAVENLGVKPPTLGILKALAGGAESLAQDFFRIHRIAS